MKRLQQLYYWDSVTFDTVNWALFHNSLQSQSLLKGFFQTKLLHQILPLNQPEHHHNLSPTPYCPSRCQCPETFIHFFNCPHHQRQQHLHAILHNVLNIFKTNNGDPFLQTLFQRLFLQQPINGIPPPYKILGNAQAKLGPHSLHLGLLHTHWTHLQHQFLIRNHYAHKQQQSLSLFKVVTTAMADT